MGYFGADEAEQFRKGFRAFASRVIGNAQRLIRWEYSNADYNLNFGEVNESSENGGLKIECHISPEIIGRMAGLRNPPVAKIEAIADGNSIPRVSLRITTKESSVIDALKKAMNAADNPKVYEITIEEEEAKC